MHCDRAQEFFTDYLERTLDRPMTIALESHLAGCGTCREELEGLQAVCLALDSFPEVEPPPDGAWQVIRKVRESRQVELPVRRAPTFLDWLRSFNPFGVALGAGLATLVLGGMLLVSRQEGTWLDILPRFGGPAATELPPPAFRANSLPAIQVERGPVGDAGEQLDLKLTPAVDLPDGEIRVSGDGIPTKVASGVLRHGETQTCPVAAPPGVDAQVLHVTTKSKARGLRYDQTVVVSLVPVNAAPVTLSLVDQRLDQVLQRLVPHVGRVVVIDGPADVPVTLQAGEQPAMSCLQDVAEQAHLVLKDGGGGVIRLVPQQ